MFPSRPSHPRGGAGSSGAADSGTVWSVATQSQAPYRSASQGCASPTEDTVSVTGVCPQTGAGSTTTGASGSSSGAAASVSVSTSRSEPPIRRRSAKTCATTTSGSAAAGPGQPLPTRLSVSRETPPCRPAVKTTTLRSTVDASGQPSPVTTPDHFPPHTRPPCARPDPRTRPRRLDTLLGGHATATRNRPIDTPHSDTESQHRHLGVICGGAVVSRGTELARPLLGPGRCWEQDRVRIVGVRFPAQADRARRPRRRAGRLHRLSPGATCASGSGRYL